jgi:hypothetical protein
MSERKATIGGIINELSVLRSKIDISIRDLSVDNFQPDDYSVDEMAEQFAQHAESINSLFEKVESELAKEEL